MNPFNKKKAVRGRVLFAKDGILWKTRNGRIYRSFNEGKDWDLFYSINTQRPKRYFYRIHIINRLLRKGIHQLNISEKGGVFFIYDNKTGCIIDNEFKNTGELMGSRPLSFECLGGKLLYGEYRSNPERSEIGIWGIDAENLGPWQKLYAFDSIRHIHGIYQDNFDKSVWISTGDEDNEAAIYRSDDGLKSFKKILYGSQQTRTIKLLMAEKFVYFGSDAPHEINYIYRYDKQSGHLKKLAQVGSSVFHGASIQNWILFSTAIEPSKVNKTRYAEIWASPNGEDWKCIVKLKKDILSMKYFQYGQIFFSNGDNHETIWISPFGTEFDNKSFCLSVSDIKGLYNLAL